MSDQIKFTPPVYDQEFFDAMDAIARLDAETDYDPEGLYTSWLLNESKWVKRDSDSDES